MTAAQRTQLRKKIKRFSLTFPHFLALSIENFGFFGYLEMKQLLITHKAFAFLSFQVVIPDLHFIAISVSIPLSLFSLIVELLGPSRVHAHEPLLWNGPQ